MPIKKGDVKLLASKVMADVPNGGGGPSAVVIVDGAINDIFDDVTELARSTGSVSVRQVFVSVQTPDTSKYMDSTIVVSKPPNDPNVSVTLAKCAPFARRTEIANALGNYLIQSSEWPGFLLENHVADERTIRLFQRPGTPPPPIGRTLALIQSEGLPAQITQYVRITKVESVTRTFTESTNNGYADYQATVVTCELTDVLRSNFAGSPPSRMYARNTTKTVVRDTTVADAATFFGATTLTAVGALGDSVLKVSSIYTQLVPSSRTESIALDQKPASQRTLTLATAPRKIEVGVTPHTMRVRVGQENRGFAWTQMLKPRPAPGTLVIDYMALGNWCSVMDDGTGKLTGAGVGTVNHQTGSLALTTPSMPDAGSSIIFSWGENTAYTSRAGQAGYRAPEFAFATPQAPLKPGAQVVRWLSGGVLKTATDNGHGAFTGDATGEIVYASGKMFLRPTAMIDAGGEFNIDYVYASQVTKQVTGLVPDAGGFVNITLDEVPAPNSVTVRWVTVRNVSKSSGSTELVTNSGTAVPSPSDGGCTVVIPPMSSANFYASASASTGPDFQQKDYFLAGSTILLDVAVGELNAPQSEGTYTWHLVDGHAINGAASSLNTVLSSGDIAGTIDVRNRGVSYLAFQNGLWAYRTATSGGGVPNNPLKGFALIPIAANAPDITFAIEVRNQAGTVVAVSTRLVVDATGSVEPINIPPVKPPNPCIFTREPILIDDGQMGVAATGGMMLAGVDGAGKRVYVTCTPLFNKLYGYHYDAPARTDTVFSAADLAAGKKTLTSAAGVSTDYPIFGA